MINLFHAEYKDRHHVVIEYTKDFVDTDMFHDYIHFRSNPTPKDNFLQTICLSDIDINKDLVELDHQLDSLCRMDIDSDVRTYPYASPSTIGPNDGIYFILYFPDENIDIRTILIVSSGVENILCRSGSVYFNITSTKFEIVLKNSSIVETINAIINHNIEKKYVPVNDKGEEIPDKSNKNSNGNILEDKVVDDKIPVRAPYYREFDKEYNNNKVTNKDFIENYIKSQKENQKKEEEDKHLKLISVKDLIKDYQLDENTEVNVNKSRENILHEFENANDYMSKDDCINLKNRINEDIIVLGMNSLYLINNNGPSHYTARTVSSYIGSAKMTNGRLSSALVDFLRCEYSIPYILIELGDGCYYLKNASLEDE